MKRKGKKGKKHRGAYASLFGVGAPEVLVIGVVALLIFGPKGLAEAARSLGKTIRAFRPTIKELQEVSREFKSSLEREIGLDEINRPASGRNTFNRTPETSSESGESLQDGSEVGYTADEYLKVTEAQLQRARASQDQAPLNETPQDDDAMQTPPKPTPPKSDT